MWTEGVSVEEAAEQQLRNVASLPFIFKHLAVMPNVHLGQGATVGSVIATKVAVVPSAVGVDIGCGMTAVKTIYDVDDLPSDLHELRLAIEAAVPHGRTDNGGVNDRGSWGNLPTDSLFESLRLSLLPTLQQIIEESPRLGKYWDAFKAFRQLGTLGTGNHFIEICRDTEGAVWVMLHSGSRGIGNAIGSEFKKRAEADAKKYFIQLPDPDLAYLPEGTPDFDAYMKAVDWAQHFAAANRKYMMSRTLMVLNERLNPWFKGEVFQSDHIIDCHHNYVIREHHFGENVLVTRKGAVRAREGDLGIIPGAMGVRSYIVRGKGNPDSFMSCSHGAGRVMSRTKAKKTFSLQDHALATAGLECRKDSDVIDETPGAYKPLDQVMAAQTDLVEVVHTLNALICVKG
jgi:tRNA-splicing ligase RtcB